MFAKCESQAVRFDRSWNRYGEIPLKEVHKNWKARRQPCLYMLWWIKGWR